MSKTTMTSQQIALEAAQVLDSKQAHDIRLFDLREMSAITDFMIVATGTSQPHLKALAAGVRKHLKQAGINCYRIAGEAESGWVAADYLDVVIHLLSAQARTYYALEQLWTKAREVPLPQA